MLFTTPPTTSWSAPRPLSRTPLSKSIPLLSRLGTSNTMVPRLALRRVPRKLMMPLTRRPPTTFNARLAKDKRPALWILLLMSNSHLVDYLLASLPDQAKVVAVMDIFWKERNLNSTPRCSSVESSKLISLLICCSR